MKPIFLFFSFLLVSTSAKALVSLSLSENQVPLGSAVQLTIQSDKEINPYSLATEIGKKAKIRGQSSSTNIQITNKTQTTLHTLSFTIFPLSEGETVFGPFEINQEKTNSVALMVLPPQQLGQNNQPDSDEISSKSTTPEKASHLLFQAEALPNQIYEGQTGIYKLKLFDPINAYNINIQPPKNHHLAFSKLDFDTVKQEKINETIGNLYQSYYAFTPIKSGTYQIGSAEISASIPTKSKTNDIHSFFDMAFNDRFLISPFQSETPIYYQSNPIEIEVLEKPKNWTGWWLASSKVTLEQEFKMPDKVHLGDAIERRVTLKVAGVEPSKLPTLSHPSSDEYSFFSNPEQRYFLFENEEIISVETQEFLIIPQKEGILQLPPLQVKYFDTKTKEEKTIQTEGKEISVLPPLSMVSNIKEKTPPPVTPKVTSQEKKTEPEKSTESLLFLIIGIVSSVLLLLITGFYLKYKKKKHFSPIQNIDDEPNQKKKKKPLPDLYPF